MSPLVLRRGHCVAALVLFVLAASSAAAGALTIAWDRSPDSRVRGYVVFIAVTPGRPIAAIDVGAVTSYVFSSAQPGGVYYFSVASYDASRTIGARSPEVSSQVHGTISSPPVSTSPGGTRVASVTDRRGIRSTAENLSRVLPSSACAVDGPCYVASPVLDGAGSVGALAVTRDGRLFFVEDAWRVQVVSAGGEVETALVPERPETRVVGLALDPAFAISGLAFTAEVTTSRDGVPELELVRYRVAGNQFGERAVIAAGLPAGAAVPVLAIDTAGHLFAALPASAAAPSSPYEGLLLRITTSGTVPRDNPLPTPVYARSHDVPTAVADDTINGTLLLAGSNRIPAADVTQVQTGEPPAVPAVASTVFLAGPAGQLLRADRNADRSYRITALDLGAPAWRVAAVAAVDSQVYVAIAASGQPGAILRLDPARVPSVR